MRHPILRIAPVEDEVYEVSDLRLRRFSERRLWLFDLEATGLDTRTVRVTQIAGVPLEGGEILEDQAFSELVDPGVEIPQEIVELTGITQDRVRGARAFPEVWDRCIEAARSCELWIGQSVYEFDVPLLEAELARHGRPGVLPPILDSVVLATHLLGEPDGRWSTSSLIQRFDVDISGLRRHDALDDVKILGRTLLPMIEMVEQKHDDALVIPRERPLRVKRHPPIK